MISLTIYRGLEVLTKNYLFATITIAKFVAFGIFIPLLASHQFAISNISWHMPLKTWWLCTPRCMQTRNIKDVWIEHTLYMQSMDLGTPWCSDIPYIPNRDFSRATTSTQNGTIVVLTTRCYFKHLHSRWRNCESQLALQMTCTCCKFE